MNPACGNLAILTVPFPFPNGGKFLGFQGGKTLEESISEKYVTST